MATAVQSQIGFQCRKLSVRRKMDFDESSTSPSKSPRKENVEERSSRLTRSASRLAKTPSQRALMALRSSPKKQASIKKKLIQDQEASPAKGLSPFKQVSSTDSPRKTPKKVLGETNLEDNTICIKKTVRSLFSDSVISPVKASPLKCQVTIPSPKKTPKKNVDENVANNVSLPRSSPRKIHLQKPSVSNFTKARQALHTSTPATIFCRDKELASIASFLQPAIDNRKPGSMYISGRPGTGKTACITYTLNNKTFSGKFKSIFINCMVLHTPASIYQQIAQQLDPKWNANTKEALAFLEEKLTGTGPMIVLILDEIDQMSTRDQSVLYTLFGLPALEDSRLILIGLANALDLTDRALIRLQSRVHLKPVLLNFPPYSKQDIATILGQRIREAVSDDVNNVIAPSALQYLGGKISSSSGDLRKAIDVCRRAVELAETTAKKQLVLAPTSESVQNGGAGKCVGIPLLCKMMASVESNRFCAGDSNEEADETPLQQKLIIVTLLVLVKLGKSKQVTLGKLHGSYGKVCSKFGVTAMDFDEFANTCSLVESRGIVTVKTKSNARLTPICLRLDEREVESTLKDKTLLSSILTQGSLFI